MNLVGAWDAVAVEDGIPLGKDIESCMVRGGEGCVRLASRQGHLG